MDRTSVDRGVDRAPAHTRVGPHRVRVRDAEAALRELLEGGSGDFGAAVRELRGAWEGHTDFTEAPEGLFDEMLATSLEVAPEVDRLRRDHVGVAASLGRVEGLLNVGVKPGDPRVHDAVVAILKTVDQHRRRGESLLYDLYSVDPAGGG